MEPRLPLTINHMLHSNTPHLSGLLPLQRRGRMWKFYRHLVELMEKQTGDVVDDDEEAGRSSHGPSSTSQRPEMGECQPGIREVS